jgi:radical SAM protein with 4Fe4S-binding SPASM domain
MKQFIRYFRLLFISLNYITYPRIANFFKLIIAYFLSLAGFEKIKSRSPFFISVEASNYCNLHCPECPVGIDEAPRPFPTTFDEVKYKALIDELSPTLFHVIFYFQGEPFLHRSLSDLIKYAHNARIYTSTSTNGHYFTEKTTKDIVLSGLDKLIVSIDGSTQEVYEKYRKGGNLQKVIDGIKSVVAWKKQLHSVTPLIEIQFIVFKTNEHQLMEMKQLAKLLDVDRLAFKTAQLYDFENGNNLLTTIDKYARYKKGNDGKYHIKSTLPNHCQRLWGGAVVNTQGEILPCCFDKGSEFSFGNINDQSFAKNWHSAKAADFRGKILTNRKQFEMCRNCTSR